MSSPYVRRLRLAAELKALRTERGWTHEQLAREIGQSRAQISRLENGHVVDQDDVIRILEALGIDDGRWAYIVTIAREAGERGWWESNKAMGDRQALYANLEAGAKTIREFQLTFIPGLLQTPEFAMARGESDRMLGRVSYKSDKAVAGRLGRQRMLRRPGGPTYEVVIDELAIRRAAAPSEVIKAQLHHIAATVNGNARVNARVLPIDARIDGFVVPRSAFSIYTFDDPDDPTVVAVDTSTADLILTEDDAIQRYVELHRRLVNAALPPDDSLDFLLEAATASRHKAAPARVRSTTDPAHRADTPAVRRRAM